MYNKGHSSLKQKRKIKMAIKLGFELLPTKDKRLLAVDEILND